MVLIYSYNDMVWSLVSNILDYSINPGHIIGVVDFFSIFFFKYFLQIFGILGATLVQVANILICSICTYLLFRSKLSIPISTIFTLLYSFSTYSIFRLVSLTPNLLPIFLFPLFIYLLGNFYKEKNKSYVVLGTFLFIIPFISAYYAYFILVLTLIYFIFGYFGYKKFLVMGFSLLLLFTLFLFPVIKDNLLLGSRNLGTGSAGKNNVYRPIEDWYNFSFRPWYFFIPPKSSLFFGNFSNTIYNHIEETGYYLANDYDDYEAGGSYMGWHFYIGLSTVFILLLFDLIKKKRFSIFQTVYKNKKTIYQYLFAIIFILLISHPPSFTISGVTFYTPSYILYYIVPFFRVLVRWSVVIYLFVLIINSFLVQDLYNLMRSKIQRVFFVLIFLVLNFFIFAVNIPVVNINNPPAEIALFKELTTTESPVNYLVYPSEGFYDAFWMLSHKNYLVNPPLSSSLEINKSQISDNLITSGGFTNAIELTNTKYILLYLDRVSEDDLLKIQELNPAVENKSDLAGFFEQYSTAKYLIGGVYIFELK